MSEKCLSHTHEDISKREDMRLDILPNSVHLYMPTVQSVFEFNSVRKRRGRAFTLCRKTLGQSRMPVHSIQANINGDDSHDMEV